MFLELRQQFLKDKIMMVLKAQQFGEARHKEAMHSMFLVSQKQRKTPECILKYNKKLPDDRI